MVFSPSPFGESPSLSFWRGVGVRLRKDPGILSLSFWGEPVPTFWEVGVRLNKTCIMMSFKIPVYES